MNIPSPHFLLFSESTRTSNRGQWRFVLQSVDGTDQLEASDSEPNVRGERLELLAVVRGLEALPQPSRVTLVTPSRYVNRGLNYGLAEWRTNDWQWEHFGEMAPIKNRDLWQRIDRALEFHSIDCRLWRFDSPEGPAKAGETHSPLAGPHYLKSKPQQAKRCEPPVVEAADATAMLSSVKCRKSSQERCSQRRIWRRIRVRFLRFYADTWESLGLRLRQFGMPFSPPWFD